MEGYLDLVEIDAVGNVPLFGIQSQNRNKRNSNLPLNVNHILEEFTIEDYKSVFFLCMDYISLDKFLSLRKEKTFLKKIFYHLYYEKLSEPILVELLGTMKMYNHLKSIGTCYHIYNSKEKDFNGISNIWKVLFALCEEIDDDDLQSLKQLMPDDVKDQILSAEEWFIFALQQKMITQTDLSYLKTVFSDNAECLSIISKFKVEPQHYAVKTPTIVRPCGLAVIFNFETFGTSTLSKRDGSNVDVCSLEKMWKIYGFKIEVLKDLHHSDVFRKMEDYAKMDHSDHDAFVCCFLSHGDSNVIFASDGRAISIPDIINSFCDNCKSLNMKPKLFFIQACQGTKVLQAAGEPVYQLQTVVQSPNSIEKSTCISHKDVLRVISTVTGFVSFRSPEKGSWFIQTLCNIMLSSDDLSITEIITLITDEVSKHSFDFGPGLPRNAIQIVPTFTTLGKTLKFKKMQTC